MPDENPPSTSNTPEAAAGAPATPVAPVRRRNPREPRPLQRLRHPSPRVPYRLLECLQRRKPEAVAAAAAPAAVPGPEVPPKIKIKRPPQRACDERDAKNKLCCGHLKRWYDYPKEIEALIGVKAEVYRCEFCKTLYKPDRSVAPHSYTLRY
jgi:hypothetical protein